jgi:hypothetical protein
VIGVICAPSGRFPHAVPAGLGPTAACGSSPSRRLACEANRDGGKQRDVPGTRQIKRGPTRHEMQRQFLIVGKRINCSSGM